MASMAVSKLTPSLSAAAPSSGSVGSAIAAGSITGLLSGTANGAGGTVAFTVVGPQSTAPSSCAGAGKPAGSAVVSGDGTYHPSFAFTPTAPGRYWWFATYGGDAGDASTTSACGASMASTVVVLPRPTLGNLKQTHTKWQPGSKMPSIFRSTSVTPVGTTFTFTLNEPATVKLLFTHVVNRRTLTAGTLSLPGHLGSDRILFQGRLSATKKLAPGTYTVAFTATNTAHQSTAPQKLTFTIV